MSVMNIDTVTEETFILNPFQEEVVNRVLASLRSRSSDRLQIEEIANLPITGTAWTGTTLKRVVLSERYVLSFNNGQRMSSRFGYVGESGLCLTHEPESTGNDRCNWIHRWFSVLG